MQCWIGSALKREIGLNFLNVYHIIAALQNQISTRRATHSGHKSRFSEFTALDFGRQLTPVNLLSVIICIFLLNEIS